MATIFLFKIYVPYTLCNHIYIFAKDVRCGAQLGEGGMGVLIKIKKI